MTTQEIQELNDAHILNTYGPRKIALGRGEGCRLWDVEGREYLDMFAGIAVCNLGHAHPAVTKAVCEQASKLVHVSNLYYIPSQVELADLLSANCFASHWFFCNGGAEANEAAIKLARRFWSSQEKSKPTIIAMESSFHGRTMGALTLTGQPKYHHGFEPLLPGVKHVPYDDIAALRGAITPEVGAIIVEPIQGEGGLRVPTADYLKNVRALCDEHDILLIFDEVQTGMGRTGTLFAHQGVGVEPDIMTLAKGLANGVPIGACGCTERVSVGFAPGAHAATFGGNPLSTAAALATLGELLKPGFLEGATETGAYFRAQLETLKGECAQVVEVRGRGLMLGVEFREPVAPLIGKIIDSGVICGPAGPNVLRFLPPLIITREDIDKAISTLRTCLKDLGW